MVYELQYSAVSFSLIRFQVMFCINSRTATYYDPEPAQQKSEYQFSAVCLHDPITELKAKLSYPLIKDSASSRAGSSQAPQSLSDI